MEEGKDKVYETLVEQVKSLIEGETGIMPNCSNVASAVFYALNEWALQSDNIVKWVVNWVGFYFSIPSEKELVLGPFQGKVACLRIKPGRGVCGKAFESKETQLVKDVHAIPDHIACDDASNAEIVIPLKKPDGTIIGVFDLDSVTTGFWTEEDKKGLEKIADILVAGCNWEMLNHAYTTAK
eukprot:TRINITY_DN45905_c0_g1_i2.p1 TRINITY_DN45905_c0_g1~~TRINITY_DN45905_c0_g1_i2.p1  ORF type:complete len:199 (-),score=9.43 TRINITY_DN45905_c0_g1_i2:105-650(-)